MERYTEEHNKLRRGPRGIRLGSSDVPVVCGISKYASPWHLWEHLVLNGGKDDDNKDENPMMQHGKVHFLSLFYSSLSSPH